jgi:hypothetical protein
MVTTKRKRRSAFLLAPAAFSVFLCAVAPAAQIAIPRIDLLPNEPLDYEIRDWRQVARDYDDIAFNPNRTGRHLPLIRPIDTGLNFPFAGVRIPPAVGFIPSPERSDSGYTVLGGIVGASLAGVDKANQRGSNYVKMALKFLNIDNDFGLVLHTADYPGMKLSVQTLAGARLFKIVDLYPEQAKITYKANDGNRYSLEDAMRMTADKWREACVAMGGTAKQWPSFLYTGYDFEESKPYYNEKWNQPDAACSITWMEYLAYVRFGDAAYLRAADWAMRFVENAPCSLLNDAQFAYGVYAAARMNAEQGRNYNVRRLMEDAFDINSPFRPDWGMLLERSWGGGGLIGPTQKAMAFAMESFEHLHLVPVARYDDRFARAIGKWILHFANSARLFYPNALPADHQTDRAWADKNDPAYCIGYEYVTGSEDTKNTIQKGRIPFAAGVWRPHATGEVNLGLYGSAQVGLLGGMVDTTNVLKILKIDLLKLDFFHAAAYPTFLYYNPYPDAKTVEIDVGAAKTSLYDAATNRFLRRDVTGTVSFALEADSAAIIVLAPADGTPSRRGSKTLVDGIVVDYVGADDPPDSSKPRPLTILELNFENELKNSAGMDFLCRFSGEDGLRKPRFVDSGMKDLGTCLYGEGGAEERVVCIDDSVASYASPLTAEIWVKIPTEARSDVEQTILQLGDSCLVWRALFPEEGSPHMLLSIKREPDGAVQKTICYLEQGAWDYGKWHHLTLIYDIGADKETPVQFYLDGIRLTARSVPDAPPIRDQYRRTNLPVTIGGASSLKTPSWRGCLDNFRLSNRVLYTGARAANGGH